MAKTPRKKLSGMTATLTFELPECEEELANAVQAMKWQQLVLDCVQIFSHWRDTSQLEGHRKAYRDVVQMIREEMKDAGLTVVSAANQKRCRIRVQKQYAKEMDAVINKSLKEDEGL